MTTGRASAETLHHRHRRARTRLGPALAAVLAAVLALSAPLAGAQAVGDPAPGPPDALPRPLQAGEPSPCRDCAALVVDVVPGAGGDALADALDERGFAVERLEAPAMVTLEVALDRFFDRLAREGTRHGVLAFRAPLVERQGRAALAAADTDRQRPALGRIDAVALPGLSDRIAASGVEGLVLVIERLDAALSVPVEPDFPPVATPRVLLLLGPEGASAALARAITAADLPGSAAARLDALAERLGTGGEARALNLPAGATPAADAGARPGLTAFLDLGGLTEQVRRDDLARALADGGLDALRRFERRYCADGESVPECAEAAAGIERLQAALAEYVRTCHRLATHPDDPATDDDGVPDSALGRAALAACAEAVAAHPDDPRLAYQYARVLYHLRNPEFARHLERAVERDYAMAAYALVLAMFDRQLSWDQGRAADLARLAADGEVTPAQILYARMLRQGFAGPPDPARAVGYLERAALDNPAAQVERVAWMIEDQGGLGPEPGPGARPDASKEPLLRRVERLLSDALRRGLLEADRVRAADLLAAVQTRLKALEEPVDVLAECRERLDIDPLDLFGLFDMVEVRGDMQENLARHQRRKLRRLDIDAVVAACDRHMTDGTAVPAALKTRYAQLLALLETPPWNRRDYGQTRGLHARLLAQAADERDPAAMFLHGLTVRNASFRGDPRDFVEGQRWLQRAHEAGVAEATFFMAIPHLMRDAPQGSGFRADPAFGLGLLDSIAGRPIPIVKVLLANIYNNPGRLGIDRAPDPRKVRRLMDEARRLGVDL